MIFVPKLLIVVVDLSFSVKEIGNFFYPDAVYFLWLP